jgi:hypothetical protein
LVLVSLDRDGVVLVDWSVVIAGAARLDFD